MTTTLRIDRWVNNTVKFLRQLNLHPSLAKTRQRQHNLIKNEPLAEFPPASKSPMPYFSLCFFLKKREEERNEMVESGKGDIAKAAAQRAVNFAGWVPQRVRAS
jgi:hypothetical protein